MLLYSLLHLTGYKDITIEDIKRFRQLGSPCAGHPEYGHGAGVETTTGPLGQGIATAVGMALAERLVAARFGQDLTNHYTYVIASDGDLMEGISHEAISLAGHLKLSRLIVLFDDNGISIDGPLSLAESGDQLARFEAAGWSASRVDGHDPEAIAAAIESAMASERPSLIACRTIIGYGAPKKQGTASSHGSPLGAEEAAGAKAALGWTHAPFVIPDQIRAAWAAAGSRSHVEYEAWLARFTAADKSVKADFERAMEGGIDEAVWAALTQYRKALTEKPVTVATRKASEMALEVINPLLPEAIGGSADLTGSNNTRTKGMEAVEADDFRGRFIHYGVREHGMAAAMNGMALHGGVIPYSGTFLVFADYCRPSIRLAALMEKRVIHVMTHDSIGLGEDGPTHQPVEHLASLRAIPNLNVFRPADAVETAECWEIALRTEKTPSVIALSRQNLPQVRLKHTDENRSARGAYILSPAAAKHHVTIIATGSEVMLALEAQRQLEVQGIGASVVSMPCMDIFAAEPSSYQDRVIDPKTVRIAVEAGSRLSWDRWIGRDGAFVGMNSFGASAPYEALYKNFNITVDHIVRAARQRL
jgi:transketolase